MRRHRKSPIDISKEEFRMIGYQLIDSIADFSSTIDRKPVTTHKTSLALHELFHVGPLPETGIPAEEIVSRAVSLLFNNAPLNGHSKFLGYITSSPAPIVALADLLAAAVNPSVGAQTFNPIATIVEKQTIQWLGEFIGLTPAYGGVLVNDGDMANFTGFLTARTATIPGSAKEEGITLAPSLTIYCSSNTPAWIEKAAVSYGHGTDAIRRIPVDAHNRMDIAILQTTLQQDKTRGYRPFIIIGTAGDINTGAIDNLQEIASICQHHHCWFHVDGVYGAPAAAVPGYHHLFMGLSEADSISLDPTKWLYSPLEAAYCLLKDPQQLCNTGELSSVEKNFAELASPATGFQSTHSLRALKLWMAFQQVGRSGYHHMIAEDIALARHLYDMATAHEELQAISLGLSITTLQYIPPGMKDDLNYLNTFNRSLLDILQQSGEIFLSSVQLGNRYCLRCCIVNFRTSLKDIEEIVSVIIREGRKLHTQLVPSKQVLEIV